MRKVFHVTALLALSLSLIVRPASATLKADISKGAGKVTTTVSGWMETAKKQMDQSATLQTMIAMGKGAAETAKKMKQLADQTKGAVTGAINSATAVADEAKGSIGDVTSGVQNVAGGVVGDTVGGVVSKTGDAQKLLGLKQEKMSLEGEQSDAIAAAQEEINAKIKLATDNISKLQVMAFQEPDKADEYESQIAVLKNQISQYNEDLKKVETDIKAQYQSKIAAVDSELTDLRNEAASQAGDAAAKKLKSLMGDKDEDAQTMNEMIKNNFLAEDEEETNENILRIQTYRRLTSAKDTVKAFNNAWRVKKTRYANDEKAEEVQGNVAQMEGSTSSLLMDVQLKVENINSLLEYTRMMVNDMKMQTANELSELTEWKLSRYDKPVTEFNLDDYAFDKKSAKQKLLDLAKGVKENGLEGTVKNAVEENTPTQTGTSTATTNTATSDPLEAVRAELRRARAGSGNYEGVDTAGPTDSAPVNVDEELAHARGTAS